MRDNLSEWIYEVEMGVTRLNYIDWLEGRNTHDNETNQTCKGSLQSEGPGAGPDDKV